MLTVTFLLHLLWVLRVHGDGENARSYAVRRGHLDRLLAVAQANRFTFKLSRAE